MTSENANIKLGKEFDYFKINLPELVSKYNGKFVVIKGNDFLGAYDSIEEAVTETTKKYELGTFLVQKCSENKDDYTMTFHSRVNFKQ